MVTRGTTLLKVQGRFGAALSLECFEGPCSQLHGATFEDILSIPCTELLDGIEMKKKLDDLLATWDHSHINEHVDFQDQLATLENLAKTLAKHWKTPVESVEISEHQGFSVVYYP